MEKQVAEILGGIALIAFVLILILGVTCLNPSNKNIVVTNNINIETHDSLEKVYVQPKIIERSVYTYSNFEYKKCYETEDVLYRQNYENIWKNCPQKITSQKQMTFSDNGIYYNELPYSWETKFKVYSYVYS
ncbi:MAG: hypothetical protein U9Q99_01460 [Nanoarchaeota archaeon]|nr:hypothetical protein [Nanoarchaeota archaeon]